jgi:hypothetical protein
VTKQRARSRKKNRVANQRREVPIQRGRGLLIGLCGMLLLGVLGFVAGATGHEGPFGSMKRYDAKTFSVSVPSSFFERLGGKDVHNGVESRTYYGAAEDEQSITIYVVSSTDMKKDIEATSETLAKNIAKNTNGNFKQISKGDSELDVKGSQEIRFSFTNLRNKPTLGVVAYARRGDIDITVTVLYPKNSQKVVESEIVRRVLRSLELS